MYRPRCVTLFAIFWATVVLADEPLDLKHPNVATIEVAVGPEAPGRRIVHLRDWHHVDFEAFSTDLRDENPKITPEETKSAYAKHLDAVEQFQHQQVEYLKHLVKEHGITAVYVEGVNPEARGCLQVFFARDSHLAPGLSQAG